MNSHVRYMQRAIALALKAKGWTSPNPIVGAVIVKNNKIIAEGWHHRAGEDHAEVDALKKINFKAQGAILYVTLEPCFHFGRTPPCVDAVIRSGVKEVVIGMKDPNSLTNGKSINKLRKNGIKVTTGILEKECKVINEPFVKYIKTKMPFVVVKSAQTVDGKIAGGNGLPQWITSLKTRRWSRAKRDEFDAILVGVGTVLADDPRLNGVKKKTDLKKIVMDSSLRTSLKAKLFQGVPLPNCFLAVTSQASSVKVKLFRRRGVQVLVCPSKEKQVDLKYLFRELAKKEITSILIEGGAEVIRSALKVNLVDKMNVYIAPKLMGEGLDSGISPDMVLRALSLETTKLEKIDKDIFIESYVHRDR